MNVQQQQKQFDDYTKYIQYMLLNIEFSVRPSDARSAQINNFD